MTTTNTEELHYIVKHSNKGSKTHNEELLKKLEEIMGYENGVIYTETHLGITYSIYKDELESLSIALHNCEITPRTMIQIATEFENQEGKKLLIISGTHRHFSHWGLMSPEALNEEGNNLIDRQLNIMNLDDAKRLARQYIHNYVFDVHDYKEIVRMEAADFLTIALDPETHKDRLVVRSSLGALGISREYKPETTEFVYAITEFDKDKEESKDIYTKSYIPEITELGPVWNVVELLDFVDEHNLSKLVKIVQNLPRK